MVIVVTFLTRSVEVSGWITFTNDFYNNKEKKFDNAQVYGIRTQTAPRVLWRVLAASGSDRRLSEIFFGYLDKRKNSSLRHVLSESFLSQFKYC